ncbi:uncharacterized protein [Choristoneura fumiferana]|uniref:uncharacterized protein n=1 Tax=Choristoneura fumiferana TaxID=7141 RepID=UPI003D158F7B
MSDNVFSDDRSVSPSSINDIKANCNNIVLIKFIETFETFPELWDVTRIEYRNKDSRNDALDQLLTIQKQWNPNATRDDVRKKINSLRSNFRKELKKIEASKRLGKKYYPKSTTFKALRFLYNAEKKNEDPKPSTRPQKVSTETSSTTATGFSYLVNPEDVQHTSRLKHENCMSDNQSGMNEMACVLSEYKRESQTSSLEPITIVWTQKLRCLDPTQRLYAEKAINDILFEAQLNNLNRDSVQINKNDSTK